MLKKATAQILIVDDSASNCLLLTEMLDSVEYRIQVAYNGKTAWQLINSQSFDLILLDIMMPQMNGIELLSLIRQQYDMQQLPVILVSALSDNNDIVKGLEHGANDYVTKPIAVGQVRARVQNQLRLKQLTDERRRTLMALQHTNQIKNRLMRIATHDLRNPISSLNVALKSMALPSTDEAHRGALIENSLDILATMDEIIGSFLNVGILQNDDLAVDLQPVSIEKCVNDVYSTFFKSAMQKRIHIERDIAAGYALADPQRLKQVITNLISNAVKFAPHDTTVKIIGRVEGGQFVLRVCDEGVGVSEDEHHLLFKPFSKLSSRPTDGEPSTGLGLWIVKQMMDLQNGSVGINDQYAHGAEFWIRLPLAVTEVAANRKKLPTVRSVAS